MTVLKREYEDYLKSLEAWRKSATAWQDQAQAYSASVGGENPQLWKRMPFGSGWQQLVKDTDGWKAGGPTVDEKPAQWLEKIQSDDGSIYQVRTPESVSEKLVAKQNEGSSDWYSVDDAGNFVVKDADSIPSVHGLNPDLSSWFSYARYQKDDVANYREDGPNLYQLTPKYPARPDSNTPPEAPKPLNLTLQQEAQLRQLDPDAAITAGMINNDSKGTVAQRFAGFGNDDSSEGMVARAIKETKR